MGALLNTNMLILILWGRRDHTHSNTLRLKGYKQSCYLTLNLLFEKGALLHLHFEVGESVKGKCTVTLPPPWNLRLNSHWLLTKKFRSNQKVGGGGSYFWAQQYCLAPVGWPKNQNQVEPILFSHIAIILSVCSPAYLKQSEIGRSNLNFSESLLREVYVMYVWTAGQFVVYQW